MNFTYTVILDFDGIRRHYLCEDYFDAAVLVDALERRYGHSSVELRCGVVCQSA